MKKKIVSILLCVTMVAAMAVGCGSKDGGSDSKSESGDSKDKKYKVGITIQSLSNAYWAGVMGKLEEQLKDKGWDYTLIDCEDNSATQVSQIENFITSGCDLIMVHPSDAKAVENICKEALDADIKVMCWDDPMENTTANWVLDNTELGKEIGKTAAEFINDKFTADDKAQVTVIGYPSTKVLKERADGIKEGLKENCKDNYEVIAEVDGLEAPEGFTAGTTTYKDWDVLSYESPNKKITVVCLKDEDGENHWFIMDAEKDVFTPYQEYSSQYNRYIITAVPDGVAIPDGFKETTLKIGDNSVVAYQSDDIADKDLYLVYAINVEGEEGFYEYDAKEQAFLRYVPMIVSEEVLVPATPTVATPSAPVEVPTEKSPFTNPLVIGIMVGAAVIIVILVVCLVIFAGRINKQNKEMLDAEDMIAQLANANKDVNPELLQKLGLDKPEVSEELEAPQAETADEKLADAVIDGSTGSEIPTVQEAEKLADPSDLEQTSEIPKVDSSILTPEVNALVEEVNRDFQTSMGGGEAYVEKSEKELAHEDYEKRSMEINNKIMTNYDSQMDSVFADGTQNSAAPDASAPTDTKE